MERRPEAERPRASAGDVLGRRNGASVDPRWRSHYDNLMDIRERLIGRRGDMGELSSVEEANHSINPADRGTEEYDTGARFGQFSSDQEALFEIDQALRRIEEGTYGVCEVTGKPIPEDRLEAVPWARYAKDVEVEIENDRASRKPRHVF
jgi:RNA polymerase-binding transcription factor DksA